jgi:hypothetical protein
VEGHHGWRWGGASDSTSAAFPCVWDCVGAAVGGAGAGNLSRLTGWEDDPVSGLGGSPRGRQGGAGYGRDGYRGGSKSGTCIITGDARFLYALAQS